MPVSGLGGIDPAHQRLNLAPVPSPAARIGSMVDGVEGLNDAVHRGENLDADLRAPLHAHGRHASIHRLPGAPKPIRMRVVWIELFLIHIHGIAETRSRTPCDPIIGTELHK